MGCRESVCNAPDGEDVDHDAGQGPSPMNQSDKPISVEENTICSNSVLQIDGPSHVATQPPHAGAPKPLPGSEAAPLSPTLQSHKEYGQNVIRELSEMKDELWDRVLTHYGRGV